MGIHAFQTNIEKYFAMHFYAIQNLITYEATDLTVHICNTGHNTEQSKDILIFRMLSSAFPLTLVTYNLRTYGACQVVWFYLLYRGKMSQQCLTAGNGFFFMDQTYCGY